MNIMTITRGLSAAVIVAGVALGSASPAWAAEPMDGVYTFTAGGDPPATWTIYSTCVPVVGDLRVPLYLAVGCTLHVASSTPNRISQQERAANFTENARLVSDRWSLTVDKPEGVLCADGSTAPSTDTYSFDDATLTGTHTITHNAVCGMQPGVSKEAFTLTFLGPPPIPVARYPLQS
jgi:hypothetical protein